MRSGRGRERPHRRTLQDARRFEEMRDERVPQDLSVTEQKVGNLSIPERAHITNAVSTRALDTRAGFQAVTAAATRDEFIAQSRQFVVRQGTNAMPVGVKNFNDNIADGAVRAPQILDREVGQLKIGVGVFRDEHFPLLNVGGLDRKSIPNNVWVPNENIWSVGAGKVFGELALDNIPTLGLGKLSEAVTGDSTVAGPPQADKGVRKILGNGSSRGAAASDHTHSIPFKTLAPAAQGRLLELRGRVRDWRRRARRGALTIGELNEAFADVSSLTLGLAHLAFDDEGMTAEERARKLRTDGAFRLEAASEDMHDYGRGLEPRRKKRFGREVHEDLAT